ncbi:ATP-binding cassette domain-containing protein [Bacillus altitudinis MN12]|uniref:iron ABC transporter ATP-binding protein n=1 Tax=Bacillus altitudinis TaxID=293387 RepID=UPI00042F4766|nr:ATP-binding cassette domain-containing protein [Bacillus altitudinis]AHL70883.1 iron ABC transporter ATP-binding protein [Bacillus pumilus]MDH8709770.1 iron complex transport system ATP-binding protein [Micromonospora sp. 1209]ATP93404.1 iron ABC transporter ATP-binding protein [Bacillus altitudinis]MBR0582223.1 ATP-binding cassette domain-containing protein [Bacillus altitudinis MN12]MBR0594833.1 ATP-binding cassette domain-containing protein [Bacillus altitudinis C16B11]
MVVMKGVSKTYKGKTVLHETTVSVKKGQLTSLIGPNGAGKSTLLSIMSRLIQPDTGEAYLEDKPYRAYSPQELAKKMSILKQSNHMSVRLTVRELVSFGRFPYSQGRLTKEDENMIDVSLQYMRLVEIQHQYLDELSGGQRQRAFIAMVLAQDTDYIFLDEPLNNLDMNHSVEMMKLFQQLVKDLGKTIVVVLHDINFASVYSDHIVALKEGQVIKEGSVDEVIQTEALEHIYDMRIPIEVIRGERICLYFS